MGSPTDCAAMVPTISPAATMLACHFFNNDSHISPSLVCEHGRCFFANMDNIYECTKGTCKVACSNGVRTLFNSDSVMVPLSLYLLNRRSAGTDMAHFSPSLVC